MSQDINGSSAGEPATVYGYRHGDLLLVPVATIPKNAREVEGPFKMVGADGHSHALNCKVFITGNDERTAMRYLLVEAKTPLTHDEHPIVDVEPGVYEQGTTIQRDYARTVYPLAGGSD